MNLPILIKLPIFTYFKALIMNIMMTFPTNLIFKVKTKTKLFLTSFLFTVDKYWSRKKYFSQKLQRIKGSFFNVLHMFALKPLFIEKNEIFEKKKKFQKDELSHFHKIFHIYVFWRAEYKYNSENCRVVDFHGETIKKP